MPGVNISILAAGAGGMYCGSCMRDNALANALRRLGHQITLIPLFTPLRTERPDASIPQVFYGGVNVYLQHATRLFRKTPRLFDWLFDRPWLLNIAGRYGATTPPEQLGGLTLDVLRGEDGPAVKELRRLLQFMKHDVRPHVVSIPNLMFIGVAPVLKNELGVPVVCELSGEDIFLDALAPRDRDDAQRLIRKTASHVDRFIATSSEYAGRMAEYLDVDREEIDVVYPSVSAEYLSAAVRADESRPPTVGYLARICPEKGVHRLIDAMLLLWQMPGMSDVRLKVAGYLGKRDAEFYEQQQARVRSAGKAAQCEFRGEVTRDEKLELLDGCDVFSMPTQYVESKGISVLEAWSRGVPVVQPAHGSFPELIDKSGGAGVLVPPGDASALAESIATLLRDRGKCEQMGRLGKGAVAAHFTDDHMARSTIAVFESLVGGKREPALV
jgi:glycosyltransferase involved in cell wall biosynthesis